MKNLLLLFVIASFLYTPTTIYANTRCGQCWNVWAGNIKMATNFANMASENSNGLAGGETADWWNSKRQDYYERIRECCTEDEMEERCGRITEAESQRMCLGLPAPESPSPDADNSRDPSSEEPTDPNSGVGDTGSDTQPPPREPGPEEVKPGPIEVESPENPEEQGKQTPEEPGGSETPGGGGNGGSAPIAGPAPSDESTVPCMRAGEPLLSPADWNLLDGPNALGRQEQIDLVVTRMLERGLFPTDWTPQTEYRATIPPVLEERARGRIFRAITRQLRGPGTKIFFFPDAFETPRYLVRTVIHESKHVWQRTNNPTWETENDIQLHAAGEVDARLYEIENAHLAQLTDRETSEIFVEISSFMRRLPLASRNQFDSRIANAHRFVLEMAGSGGTCRTR